MASTTESPDDLLSMPSTTEAAEAGIPGGTLDIADGNDPEPADPQSIAPATSYDAAVGADPESIERTPDSSRSYAGSTMKQYCCTVFLSVVVLALLSVAVALSAVSLQRSNEALTLATENSESLEIEQALMGSEMMPPPSPPANAPGTITTPASIIPITPPPTPPPTTAKPTEPHPLNPQWFQTTHRDYQMFQEMNQNSTIDHGWHNSNLMCSKNNLYLCGYDTYCPNGQGGAPYSGGPPEAHNTDGLEVTQWAPYQGTPNDEYWTGTMWVQIGLMPESEGGNDGNYFVQCWTLDDWYAGSVTDVEDLWEDDHRMWVLCCEKPEEEEDFDEGDGRY